MARTPVSIPKAARDAWAAGDEPRAEQLSGLKSRQLRNRLGPPGRGAPAKPVAAAATPPPGPRLVKVTRAPKPAPAPVAAPSPEPGSSPDAEPTVEAIARVDTREEAEAIYRAISAKLALADDVRFASLAEKALAALNRIEQIDKRRPAPPAPDAVHEALRGEMDACVEHLLRHTSAAAEKLARDRAELFAGLDIAPGLRAEVQRRVDAMLGGA